VLVLAVTAVVRDVSDKVDHSVDGEDRAECEVGEKGTVISPYEKIWALTQINVSEHLLRA
jgi:hypothetical protein